MYSRYIAPTLIVAGTIFVTLLLINIFHIEYPVLVTNTTRSSEFSVVGEGKVDVVPDIAYVDLGISVNNVANVQDAQRQIDQINNKIVDAMKNLGVKKEDIKTSNYSITPNYSYEGNENKITGYNGIVTITVKAHDPQLASRIIEQATAAGANQVQGSRFVVDDPSKYRKEARDKAIQNAKDQAKQISQDLGIHLGKITNIVESTGSVQPNPIMYADKAVGLGAGVAAAPDIEPGNQSITSVVTLYFEKR